MEPDKNQTIQPVTAVNQSSGPNLKPTLSKAKLLGIILGAIAVLFLAVVVGFFLAKRLGTVTPGGIINIPGSGPDQLNQSNVPHNSNVTPDQSEQNGLPTVATDADYKTSGQVAWQKSTKIAAIHEFDLPDEGSGPAPEGHYFKVGSFISGKYQGADLLIVIPGCDCPGEGPMARVVKLSGKYIVLGKYSDPSYTLDATTKYTLDKDYSLSDLEFPETITGPQSGQNLYLENNNVQFKDFSEQKNLTSVFVDTKLGQVYTDDQSADGWQRNGFYIKAPDNTTVTYFINPNFVNDKDIPQLTWNDGKENAEEYIYHDIGGCGSTNLASVAQIDKSRLIAGGKTSHGDLIYLLKDSNDPLFKDLYDNNYFVPEGETKLSYSDFVKSRPYFYWLDPFNRLIQFKNSKFLPMAECAKPVIYLYPTSPEQVHVNLSPVGGFTYTEPAYNNGWSVLAEPSGMLTELSSGKQYPYLFWEGRGGYYEIPKKGFVIAQKDLPQFFQSKLKQLGLNEKESADFQEYWLPNMQSYPYYFVSFMGNEVMNQIAPLSVSPRPDTIIRVLMDFKGLEKPVPVDGYRISTPQRNGFTLVEWGGVKH